MRGTIDVHQESLTTTEQLSNSMDLPGKHPFFRVSFDGPTRLSFQDASDPQLHRRGMPVETLECTCPLYLSQSAAYRNHADSVHPLTGFRITSLRRPVFNVFHMPDIPTLPVSYFVKYVPENSVQSIDDTSLIASGSCHCAQSSLSGREPGIRDPTPVNRLNSDHHLTNLPAEVTKPQDSRPVAVANPSNLQQATSKNPVNSTKIVADKSLQDKRRRDRRRQRYQNDPVYAERARECLRRFRKNPACAERIRKRRRERERERRKDPEYIERERERQRRRYRNNPNFAERQKARQRERYHNNPAYAERKRTREREHYRNDPVYAEGLKTYNRVYDRMKRIVSKEEAAKLATTAKKEYLQSVKCPDDSQPVTVVSPPGVETSENLPSSISESPDGAQAPGAAGKLFTSPPEQMPMTALDSEERCQDEASEVSINPAKADSGRESEINIAQLRSMAVEEGSHFLNNSHSNIQTSQIIQADNPGNEFVRSCVTQKNAMTKRQGNGAYKCNQCDKFFAYKSYLKRHQMIHSDEKPYKCEQCDRRFARKCYLRSHQHTHTDVKLYECRQCNKYFAQKRYLVSHQYLHGGSSPVGASNAAKSLPVENAVDIKESSGSEGGSKEPGEGLYFA